MHLNLCNYCMQIVIVYVHCPFKLVTYSKDRQTTLDVMAKALDSYVIRGTCKQCNIHSKRYSGRPKILFNYSSRFQGKDCSNKHFNGY